MGSSGTLIERKGMLALMVNGQELHLILAGAVIMACFVAGLLFLRFWRRTRDRLFLIFALAFWVMALQRILVAGMGEELGEWRALYYMIRLLAFVLILVAIVDKNRSSSRHATPRH